MSESIAPTGRARMIAAYEKTHAAAAQTKMQFLSAPARLDAKADELPRRLKLLNWGTNQSTQGPVILDELSAKVFDDNQARIGRVRCQLDFEHNTVPGSDEYNRTNEPRAVAAFGAPKLIPGEGLFLNDIDWKCGRDTALNFEDLSAAPMLDASGRVIALHSAALTKAGAVYNLPSFFDQAALAAMSAVMRPTGGISTANTSGLRGRERVIAALERQNQLRK
jgi:hypothetical protein